MMKTDSQVGESGASWNEKRVIDPWRNPVRAIRLEFHLYIVKHVSNDMEKYQKRNMWLLDVTAKLMEPWKVF